MDPPVEQCLPYLVELVQCWEMAVLLLLRRDHHGLHLHLLAYCPVCAQDQVHSLSVFVPTTSPELHHWLPIFVASCNTAHYSLVAEASLWLSRLSFRTLPPHRAPLQAPVRAPARSIPG